MVWGDANATLPTIAHEMSHAVESSFVHAYDDERDEDTIAWRSGSKSRQMFGLDPLVAITTEARELYDAIYAE